MPKFEELLRKEVGPLPVGAWLMVVAAGLGFAYWKKRNVDTSSNSSEQELSPLLTNETLGNIGGLMQLLNTGQTGPNTQTYQDNTSWYQQALRLLIGRGNDPTLTDNALRKYMNGIALSLPESKVLELALQLLGPIPTPPPPPQTTPGAEQPRTFSNYKYDSTLTIPGITHLSDYDLINAINITNPDFPLDPGWQDVAAQKYGSDDPLVYLNEYARRYKAGTIPQGALTSFKWPGTDIPQWTLTDEDMNRRLLDVANRNPSRVSWEI